MKNSSLKNKTDWSKNPTDIANFKVKRYLVVTLKSNPHFKKTVLFVSMKAI